jgi:cytochrome P450
MSRLKGFDPERCAPGRSDERSLYAHFPFGGGPLQWIGKGFALLEATLALALLTQHRMVAFHSTATPPVGAAERIYRT